MFYRRERGREVDFVAKCDRMLVAIEAKSGRGGESLPGMGALAQALKSGRTLLVGAATASRWRSFSSSPSNTG